MLMMLLWLPTASLNTATDHVILLRAASDWYLLAGRANSMIYSYQHVRKDMASVSVMDDLGTVLLVALASLVVQQVGSVTC